MPTARRSRKWLARTGSVDWDRVKATTDEDIRRQIAEDPDSAPELTEDALDRAVVVSPDGTRTPYRARALDSHTLAFKPGDAPPSSDRCNIIVPEEESTDAKKASPPGEPSPPNSKRRQRYRSKGKQSA